MNLFVTNINRAVTDDALKALFTEFGQVTSAKVMTDKYTGESKGFGFVDMADDRDAMEAIRKLSNASFFGSKLRVSKARPSATIF
jgi:RNA recognition motif-containing protein